LNKSKFFGNLHGKLKSFRNLPGKIEFLLPGSMTPRFQTRLTPLSGIITIGCLHNYKDRCMINIYSGLINSPFPCLGCVKAPHRTA